MALSVAFQNCGKAGFDGQEQLSSDFLSTDTADLKFAFDATFDQITYNSCTGNLVAGRPGFFTLMAGAYDVGGVKVTTEFLEHARTSGFIKPVYPATEITDEQIKIALANSPGNMEARPQLAIRTRGNPQQVRTPLDNAGNSQNPVEGDGYVTMLGDLTDDRWMDPLIRPKDAGGARAPDGTVSRYFNLAPGGQRSLEGTITYNQNEGAAQGMRNDFSSAGMLALTFKMRSDLGLPEYARPVDSSDLKKVHGHGYMLGFESALTPYTRRYISSSSPGNVPHVWNPNNLLTSVQEVDLRETSKISGTWQCPEARRYLIVRNQDKLTHCPPDPYGYMFNGIPSKGVSAEVYRREYEIVRRSLKAEYWDVSVEFRCASPKLPTTDGECYAADAINAGIEYDQRFPCYQNTTEMRDMYGANPPQKRCAQYVSICNRD